MTNPPVDMTIPLATLAAVTAVICCAGYATMKAADRNVNKERKSR